MNKIMELARYLSKDESGASFVEYTVLLGVILAVSIALVSSVGTFANGVWTTLNDTLSAL